MMLEVRGCFDVFIFKGFIIQEDLVVKIMQRCFFNGSCVLSILYLISLKCIKFKLKSVNIISWIFDQMLY